ncbi:MAG TPA: potassium-transporting ATPase subunit KdpC [Longimicrobiales bacterium]|nr:potassium-transporting ATPase subunit KdpC [Longimicrobiales bacterium]
MHAHLRNSVLLVAVMTVLTGVVYPGLVTALAQAFFPGPANGSLVTVNGRVIGSMLVGQPFDDAAYFWSRPSVTPGHPYNGAASRGSNLGPLSGTLAARVAARVEALRRFGPVGAAPIPVDLVTASASGLDPHLSPAAALYQVDRVAALRGLDAAAVRALVEGHVEPRTLGFVGEPVVNVLILNLALDSMSSGGGRR